MSSQPLTFASIQKAPMRDAGELFARMARYRQQEPFVSAAAFMEAQLPQSCSVLDVGPGNGEDANRLAEAGFRVTGVDVRTDMTTPIGWELLEGAAGSLPVEEGSFDAVWAGRVIHHLPDIASFIGEARRVLVPDGLLLLSWPDRSNFSCSEPTLNEPVREFLLSPHCDTAAPRTLEQVRGHLEKGGFGEPLTAVFTKRCRGVEANGYAFTLDKPKQLERFSAVSEFGPAAEEFAAGLLAGHGWVDLSITVAACRVL